MSDEMSQPRFGRMIKYPQNAQTESTFNTYHLLMSVKLMNIFITTIIFREIRELSIKGT